MRVASPFYMHESSGRGQLLDRGSGKGVDAEHDEWRRASWRWSGAKSSFGRRQVTMVVSAHTELASDAKPRGQRQTGRDDGLLRVEESRLKVEEARRRELVRKAVGHDGRLGSH